MPKGACSPTADPSPVAASLRGSLFGMKIMLLRSSVIAKAVSKSALENHCRNHLSYWLLLNWGAAASCQSDPLVRTTVKAILAEV